MHPSQGPDRAEGMRPPRPSRCVWGVCVCGEDGHAELRIRLISSILTHFSQVHERVHDTLHFVLEETRSHQRSFKAKLGF